MEDLLWLFVAVVFVLALIREDDMSAASGAWYLIYLYYYDDFGSLKVLPRPVDGVFATNTDAACEIAASRNNYRVDEHFQARWCGTAPQRLQASELDGRHLEAWWSEAEFVAYMNEQIPLKKFS